MTQNILWIFETKATIYIKLLRFDAQKSLITSLVTFANRNSNEIARARVV
jgi:hypothetical protein